LSLVPRTTIGLFSPRSLTYGSIVQVRSVVRSLHIRSIGSNALGVWARGFKTAPAARGYVPENGAAVLEGSGPALRADYNVRRGLSRAEAMRPLDGGEAGRPVVK
jgi:hypothetical protein